MSTYAQHLANLAAKKHQESILAVRMTGNQFSIGFNFGH